MAQGKLWCPSQLSCELATNMTVTFASVMALRWRIPNDIIYEFININKPFAMHTLVGRNDGNNSMVASCGFDL